MPRYDFRCQECSETFVVNRPMSQSGDPAPCPEGHADTVKVLSAMSLGPRRGGARKPIPSLDSRH